MHSFGKTDTIPNNIVVFFCTYSLRPDSQEAKCGMEFSMQCVYLIEALGAIHVEEKQDLTGKSHHNEAGCNLYLLNGGIQKWSSKPSMVVWSDMTFIFLNKVGHLLTVRHSKERLNLVKGRSVKLRQCQGKLRAEGHSSAECISWDNMSFTKNLSGWWGMTVSAKAQMIQFFFLGVLAKVEIFHHEKILPSSQLA